MWHPLHKQTARIPPAEKDTTAKPPENPALKQNPEKEMLVLIHLAHKLMIFLHNTFYSIHTS